MRVCVCVFEFGIVEARACSRGTNLVRKVVVSCIEINELKTTCFVESAFRFVTAFCGMHLTYSHAEYDARCANNICTFI